MGGDDVHAGGFTEDEGEYQLFAGCPFLLGESAGVPPGARAALAGARGRGALVAAPNKLGGTVTSRGLL
jgi:hypothetical protein